MFKIFQELRVYENEIIKVRKAVFNGLNQMIVVGIDIFIILRLGFKVYFKRF